MTIYDALPIQRPFNDPALDEGRIHALLAIAETHVQLPIELVAYLTLLEQRHLDLIGEHEAATVDASYSSPPPDDEPPSIRPVDRYITRELATTQVDQTVGYVATTRGVVGVSASLGQTRLTVVTDGVEWRARINRDLTQGHSQQGLVRACNQLAAHAQGGQP